MKTPRKRFSFSPRSFAVQLNDLLTSELSNVSPINPTVFGAFCRAQNIALLRKFPNAPDAKKTRQAAIETFVACNDRLAAFNVPFDGADPFRPFNRPDPNASSVKLWRARSVCYQILESFDTEEFFDECKHGPNSSLGVPYNDSGNSSKWRLPLTCTLETKRLFDIYAKWDTTLVDSLMRENPSMDLTQCFDIVESSKLTTVPKNDETDRTIAVEPTLCMFFQQGLGAVIARRLSRFGIDVQYQQDYHRHLAWFSSLSRSNATLDFKSASDSVSIELLRFLLPPIWFKMLDMVRTKSVMLPDKSLVTLNCFSTMGNATTFVLETLVFFALAIASHPMPNRSRFPEWETFKNVSVFGDDVILPSEDLESMITLSQSVGFVVNVEKTYFGPYEPFRESCGADYWSGYDVRPIYIKPPRSLRKSVVRAWLYSVWNALCKRLITSLGERNYAYSPTLARIAEEICRWNSEIFLVPIGSPADSGIVYDDDWVRIHRLFSRPVAEITCDRHGTYRFLKLVSVGPPCGTNSPSLEFWYAIKFPVIVTRPGSLQPFQVLKRDRGYVVTRGADCTSVLSSLPGLRQAA